MIKEAIIKIVSKQDLTYDEAYTVMNEIMNGQTTATQNAGMDTMEIVGTGGDGSHSFNISTTSMFVLAAAGVKVSKHGNRAASSDCGTADCLEALGVNIRQNPEKCRQLLEDVGLCFMFAQQYHSSMKYVGSIRRELGFRTVFNILGPITNPARPSMMLLGVYDPLLVVPLAQVLTSLGAKRGMVVHGLDGFDEISGSGLTTVCDFKDGSYINYEICPEDFGLKRSWKSDMVGGTPAENAAITLVILSGGKGPKRDVVLLNAGAGLYVAGKADSIAEGVKLAADIIDSGAALKKLEEFKLASTL